MMKQTLLNLMLRAGGFGTFRRANRRKLLIVTYHRFAAEGETGAAAGATTARAFDQQLAYLKKNYQVLPLAEIAVRLAENKELPPGAAAVTIDDGYRDAYRVAFPLLKRYGVPATIFATTGFLDRQAWLWTDQMRYLAGRTTRTAAEVTIKDQHLRLTLDGPGSRLQAATKLNRALKSLPDGAKGEEIEKIAALLDVPLPPLPPPEYEALTWDEAREMDAGGVAVESHTVNHPILTNVDDDARLRYELEESRARLQAELRRTVPLFCYPNGNNNGRVREAVARAGYVCAVSTEHGLNEAGADIFALKRVHTEADLAHFAQNTSGFEDYKNRLRGSGNKAAPPPTDDY